MPLNEHPAILKTNYGAEIAYHTLSARVPDAPTVVFLGGFMSDMEGTKALALEAFCREQGVGFVRFDYRGHGQSSDEFANGTIGDWKQDVLAVLDNVTKGGLILVGSSMGGWLALLAAIERPERVVSLVGVAAAPDFTESLIWDALPDDDKKKLVETGVYYAPSCYGEEPYPITLKLIEEARSHLLLDKAEIPISCPVHLVQGMEDVDVPWKTALAISEKLKTEDVQVSLVKNGDHRMSSPSHLDVLLRVLVAYL